MTSGTPRTAPSGRRSCGRCEARARGGPPRHLRPAPRAEGGDREGLHRRLLAALPGALPAQRPRGGAEGQDPDGRRGDQDDLRPARSGHIARQLDEVADTLSPTFPDVADSSSRRGRPPGLQRLPDRPLDEDLVDEPAGARQRRDQATHERRRHLPERRLGAPPRHRGPRRTARRVGGRRASLPLRGVDGAHRPAATEDLEEKGVSLSITA